MMTPEDLLARQTQFGLAGQAGAFAEWSRSDLCYAFRPGNAMYAMDRYFCRLVDEARQTIPGEAQFRPDTLLTPTGWIFLEEPAALPHVPAAPHVQPRLQAVGWFPTGDDVQCISLIERAGFGLGFPWSFWGLRTGQTLGEHMALLEASQATGYYATPNERLHEARWFYTAVHLMTNKVTLVARAPFARAVRRRAAGDGFALPDAFRRVTLRRVEAARLQAGAAGQRRDWHWQWTVRGHWRHYQDGKVVYVESFLKGPVGKPLKPVATPFFQVKR